MNFNISPYNDDFSVEKNMYKVLFKPGFDVQARELNGLQSILQNQVSSVGNHLFKNGAKISGCSTAFIQYDYVRLNDTFDGEVLKLTPYNNTTIKLVGEVSGVEATIVDVLEKTDDNAPTLYVVYTKTGVDNQQSTVIPGENILFYDENDVLVYTATARCPSCPENTETDNIAPIGKGLYFNIEAGIFYYNGLFIYVDDQKINIDNYLVKDETGAIVSNRRYRVGLDVVEEIVTVDDDKSLYDNHLNYPNFAAPGADRYKVSMHLSTQEYDETGDFTSFIMLAKVRENHTVEYKKDDTEYGQIMDEIARRTYESSGDFTNVAWKTKFLNEKKKAEKDTKGWSLNGSDDNFVAIIEPGLGYVKGHRVANQSDVIAPNRKARDTKKLRGASLSFESRPNITVKINGNISWLNHTQSTTLSNQQINMLDDKNASIGYFKAYDIQRLTNDTYRIYLYDINLVNAKTLSMCKSVKITDGSFEAKVEGTFNLENANNATLLFPLGYSSVKSIRDNDNINNGNTSLEIKKRFIGILDGNGSITFTSSSNERFISPLANPTICWVGSNPTGVNALLTGSNTIYNATSLTLNLGAANAGKNVTLVASVTKTSQQENTKTLTRHVYTTIAKPAGETNSIITLPHADGYKIDNIKMVSISDPDVQEDITSEYIFSTGQTDNFYKPAKLTRNTLRTFANDDRLIISYYYFEHSGTAGFFTVDSYSQLVNDPELDLEYSDIPTYKSSNGITYRLAECVDFRPIKLTDNDVPNAVIPTFNTSMVYDIEYYLPRADLLLVNSDGDFYFKQGISSENPTLPSMDKNAMALYEIYLNAYTYSMDDIRFRYIDNRRYTMKDIGKIESRVDKLEYYVSLNMLEQQTLNMSIKDGNGLDRYKNGFLVDNFKNYYGSDITHIEYRAALDRRTGQLRPQVKQNNIRMKFDAAKSAGIKSYGNMSIADFTEEKFMENVYATQSLSINPYMIFRKNGNLSLSPNIDTWSDDSFLPTVNYDIDTGVEALTQVAEASGLLGTEYGSWSNLNQSVIREVESVVNGTTTTAVTTTTTQSRDVTTTSLTGNSQSYTIDNVVKDVSIIPFIRTQTVQFYATNMKPNTQLYAYFDGVNVTQHCKKITQLSSNNDVIVNRSNAVFGAAPLVADAEGNITGEFRIPANTFFTGEKKFVLTNDPNNSGNEDVETTRAETSYFAGGVSQTKQSYSMNVVTPQFNQTTTTETRNTTSVSRETTVVATSRQVNRDPIAQGFDVEESCFISSVDVYFANVDAKSDIIWFEIREMVNGYPSDSGIARKEVKASTLLNYVSNDASKEYKVTFAVPVYVDPDKKYAFVIGGYSPETRVYISKLGDALVNNPNTYLEQPPLPNTMFRSLNGATWNAQQFDTMKFKMYRCKFNNLDTKFSFYAEGTDAFITKADENPIQVQPNTNRVRIYAKNHGLRVNDRCTIDFSNTIYYTLEVTEGMPQIGQPISTLSGTAYIKDIQITSTLNQYLVSFEQVNGTFEIDEQFTCEAREYVYRDLFLITDNGAYGSPVTQNMSLGYIRGVPTDKIPALIGGAPVKLFAKEHIVRDVEDMDSFVVEVEYSFTSNDRFGGNNVLIHGTNVKYDSFNFAGQFLTYGAIDTWTLKTYEVNGSINEGLTFEPLWDIGLPRPCTILSDKNEKRILGNNHSFEVTVEATSKSQYLSPVFNTDSFSVTTISNRIETLDSVKMNQLPGTGRYVPETNSWNGSEKFKHITTKVMLENPATDMKLLFDVFCSNESSFDVYVKVITPQNTADESNINWVKVDNYQKKTSSSNGEFTEYDLILSENCTNWNNTIEYISFRVKLVGSSNNSCKPVIFQNLRAIAIT